MLRGKAMRDSLLAGTSGTLSTSATWAMAHVPAMLESDAMPKRGLGIQL